MVCVRGGRNYAAAERTLQKQLGVIRDAQAGGAASAGSQGDKPAAAGVRPQYACRLAGTLADVIARGEREAAALGRPSGQDRRAEIVGLLRYAFEARLMRSMIVPHVAAPLPPAGHIAFLFSSTKSLGRLLSLLPQGSTRLLDLIDRHSSSQRICGVVSCEAS